MSPPRDRARRTDPLHIRPLPRESPSILTGNAADFSRVGCAILPDGKKSRLYKVFGGLFAGSYPVSQRKERTAIAVVEEFHCTDIPSTDGIDQVLIADHVVRIGYIHTLLRRFFDTIPTVWLYHIGGHFSPSNVGKLILRLSEGEKSRLPVDYN